MKNSKLIQLLSTFNTEEWRQFGEMVASPYFNKKEILVPFCTYLRKAAPDFSDKKINKKAIYKYLYPKETLDEKNLGYLMNYLLALAEQFIGLKEYEAQQSLRDYHTLNAFVKRKLAKHYQQKQKKSWKYLKDNKGANNDYFLHRYLLAEVAEVEFTTRGVRTFDIKLQEAVDALDDFYFVNKLKYCCGMLDRQEFLSSNYKLNFLQEVGEYLNQKDELPPLMAVYYEILKMLQLQTFEHFQKLKHLLKIHAETLTQDEKTHTYFYAINFCARKIRKGEQQFVEEALNLYLEGINSGVLLQDNYLSPWTYANVIKLALRLQRYDWIKTFIYEFNPKLREAFRENALYYNLAELSYYTKEYDKVLQHLNQVKFSDLNYQLGSRVILMKTYYELDEEEVLLSLIASFSIFLKRNKNISQNLKKTYLNFCNMLSQILRRNPNKKAALKEKILKTPLLTDRQWLLKVL